MKFLLRPRIGHAHPVISFATDTTWLFAALALLGSAACTVTESNAEPLSDHARAIVEQIRAEEASQLLQQPARAVVRTAWDRLVITAKDGSEHIFLDAANDGELAWVHRFGGYVDGVNAYLVVRQYLPHGEEFLLVRATTGRTFQVDAPPVASPDGKRFVTASLDLVAGHAPNRVRVFRLAEGGPMLEWEAEPREWGARNAVWLDERTIRIERATVDWNTHGTFASPMTLRREGGRWAAEPSAANARDALLSFFSALGNGHFGEAGALFGGSYDVLRGWNPELDPADTAGLWRAGCERNGLQCMGEAEVVRTEVIAPTETRFTVRFRTAARETFVLGPCCGATAEEMPPRSEFQFAVRRVGDRYLVQDLPVYVP